jgi:hypothetical protein
MPSEESEPSEESSELDDKEKRLNLYAGTNE